MVMAAMVMQAQPWYRYPPEVSHDVVGLPQGHYLRDWFDRCPTYIDPPPFIVSRKYFYSKRFMSRRADGLYASVGIAPGDVRFAGLTALTRDWILDPADIGHITKNWSFSEAMFLYKGTPETTLTLIDSVQWDTATPYRIIFPRNAQAEYGAAGSDYFMYCLAYDAYFHEPVEVNGIYTVVGTTRNNETITVFDTLYFEGGGMYIKESHPFTGIPTVYEVYSEELSTQNQCWPCITDTIHKLWGYNCFLDRMNIEDMWLKIDTHYNYWGPFLAILDVEDSVVVPPDDSTGVAAGAEAMLQFTLTPNPARGSITVGAPDGKPYSVVIHDDAGRRITGFEFKGPSTRIDVRALPSGHYLLTLTADGLSGTKSFIKQ